MGMFFEHKTQKLVQNKHVNKRANYVAKNIF